MKAPKILYILVALCLVTSVAFGTVTLLGQIKLSKTVDEIFTDGEDPAQEDDVKICSDYEIKSTLPVSDAYKSGDTSSLDDREKETLDLAKAVIDEVIEKDMTDFEKEEAIYLYLTKELKNDKGILTVIPDISEGSDNPYGVLKYKNAVCVGYATTMRLFMQMLDIECKVVHSSDCTHTWNLVKLDNEWYHTDCYMDSDNGNYANFNMDDTLCAGTHTWNKDYFPAATGTKYNYAIMNCETIDNIYSIPKWFSKNVWDEKDSFSCKFKEGIAEDEEDVAKYIADTICEGLCDYEIQNVSYENRWTKNSDDEYILIVTVTHYDSYEPDLTDNQRDMADEAIAEYFDGIIYSDDVEYYFDENGNEITYDYDAVG